MSAGPLVRDALRALGIDQLLLGIHDAAFPSLPEEETGRGSPYTEGGARLLALAADLGFTGLQLGPQGATGEGNHSPYDGTLFSRNPLSLALSPLVEEGLLSRTTLAEIAARATARSTIRADPRGAARAAARALAEVDAERLRRGPDSPLDRRLAAFRTAAADWLEADALCAALQARHDEADWRRWREGSAPHPDQFLYAPPPGGEAAAADRRARRLSEEEGAIARYALGQLLLHEQHAAFVARAHALGLVLYADLQVGISEVDAWSRRPLFLSGYRMGAPPSRTNPEGQPWNYPVLDPEQLGPLEDPGPAARFFRRRLAKAFAELDGLRLDHPHGLVCPWVYRADQPDSLRAVQAGARLFDSPDLPDHPELARFAIARPEQIDRARPRHDDAWVRDLDPEQEARYALLFDLLLAEARAAGRTLPLACEVLSTLPLPLARVLARHRLGRFRVTQKADLDRAEDVYRGENAAPEDWIMVGTHDTPPLRQVAERWSGSERRRQADYLATRLIPETAARDAWAAGAAADLPSLFEAKLAELFVGPARQVIVYFTDLFGETESYNVPGTVSEANWSLRLPSDVEGHYRARLAGRRAAALPRLLALACRARGAAFARAHPGLAERLDEATPRPPR
ncbi:MAG TPA: 4-alpha-glucanotransferase [Thermoanaerobaculia bacterium]|nr:4-alpha-glucanotransferase [Thermoanaerobaculia bacterium]